MRMPWLTWVAVSLALQTLIVANSTSLTTAAATAIKITPPTADHNKCHQYHDVAILCQHGRANNWCVSVPASARETLFGGA